MPSDPTREGVAACSCGCGFPRSYEDSNYWYWSRWPNWFWCRAARIVCRLVGHRKNCRYGDCYRCG